MSREREPELEKNKSKIAKKPVSLWSALAIALCLIVLPGLVMGPLFVPPVVVWAFCALALSFRSKFAPVRKQRLRNLAIYLFAGILIGVVHAYRIDIAQTRGQSLVSAIEAFRAENQRYPASLEELAPKYIDRIPSAVFGRYYYSNTSEAGPTFFYLTLPPFGRRGYCFRRDGNCLGKIEDPFKNEWYDFD